MNNLDTLKYIANQSGQSVEEIQHIKQMAAGVTHKIQEKTFVVGRLPDGKTSGMVDNERMSEDEFDQRMEIVRDPIDGRKVGYRDRTTTDRYIKVPEGQSFEIPESAGSGSKNVEGGYYVVLTENDDFLILNQENFDFRYKNKSKDFDLIKSLQIHANSLESSVEEMTINDDNGIASTFRYLKIPEGKSLEIVDKQSLLGTKRLTEGQFLLVSENGEVSGLTSSEMLSLIDPDFEEQMSKHIHDHISMIESTSKKSQNMSNENASLIIGDAYKEKIMQSLRGRANKNDGPNGLG